MCTSGMFSSAIRFDTELFKDMAVLNYLWWTRIRYYRVDDVVKQETSFLKYLQGVVGLSSIVLSAHYSSWNIRLKIELCSSNYCTSMQFELPSDYKQRSLKDKSKPRQKYDLFSLVGATSAIKRMLLRYWKTATSGLPSKKYVTNNYELVRIIPKWFVFGMWNHHGPVTSAQLGTSIWRFLIMLLL
jgi:hypothetical protein